VWSESHDPFLISTPAIISGTAEARVAKFCMYVEYIILRMTDYSLIGVVRIM